MLFSIGRGRVPAGRAGRQPDRVAGSASGRTIVASALLFGPGTLLIAIAPPDLAVPVHRDRAVLGGFSGVVYNINQVSLRQAITPERMQGRMNATMRFLVWGTIPIGSLIGGVLATVIGLRETILLGRHRRLHAVPVRAVLAGPHARRRCPTREAPADPLDSARGAAQRGAGRDAGAARASARWARPDED